MDFHRRPTVGGRFLAFYRSRHGVRTWRSTTAVALVPSAEVDEEMLARDEIFIGAASARQLANFVPMIDISNGLMLLIRPSDDFECQDCLWVGKATRAVCKDQGDANYNKVPIQWWRPKHASSKASITDRYSQCTQRDVAWEVDPAYSGSYWIMADSCVYAWKSKAKANKLRVNYFGGKEWPSGSTFPPKASPPPIGGLLSSLPILQ
ncbi:hypothetical protein R1sor_019680 [Riccia sorocarpa]|uniref:Uncharacterized protein n=1 Tax=Riccia sorocarpa TaxID=122646 RepID=A0ABD3IDC3_9MARC